MPGQTFARRSAEYKAQRHAGPELRDSSWIDKLVEPPVPALARAGYEADDVIGTLTRPRRPV
jgi:hypothetical protein